MQASLKLNTQNSQYILLTISNLQGEGQILQKQTTKQDQYLRDSNITHSRMTETKYNPNNHDYIKEDREQSQEILQQNQEKECPTCAAWKRWAFDQQKMMLKLEEDLMAREILLEETVQHLRIKLEEKSKAIQSYNQQLLSSKGEVANLTLQIREKEDQYRITVKEKNRQDTVNSTTAYATPLKIDVNSHRFEGDRNNLSTKMSQMLTEEKNGRTCTTAAKQKLQWSAFQTNLQKLTKENNSKCTRSEQSDKYLFENTMLKEYNAVLLQRLKQSKYRKPF